jgi:prepilin-type N-terminal cleavage/methylation domain-containing protein
MTNLRRHPDPGIRLPGFTVVECLIGLAIAAVLLTAVAAAFNASAVSYRENEQMFWSMNNARQALTRMTNEIRPSGWLDQSVSPAVWKGMAHNATPTDHCTFYLPDTPHELITYQFNSAEKKLYLVKNATNQSYALCDNVTNAVFTTMSSNGIDAKSVLITLTVREGGSERTLSAAAVLRRLPPELL